MIRFLPLLLLFILVGCAEEKQEKKSTTTLSLIKTITIDVTVKPRFVDTEFKSISGICYERNNLRSGSGMNKIDGKYICGIEYNWSYDNYVCKNYAGIIRRNISKAYIKIYESADTMIHEERLFIDTFGDEWWDWIAIKKAAVEFDTKKICQMKGRIPEGW